MSKKILLIILVLTLSLGIVGCESLEESYEGKNFILNYPEDWYIIRDFGRGEFTGMAWKGMEVADGRNEYEITQVVYYDQNPISTDLSEEDFKRDIKEGLTSEGYYDIERTTIGGEIAIKAQDETEEGIIDIAIIYGNDLIHTISYNAKHSGYNERLGKRILNSFVVK